MSNLPKSFTPNGKFLIHTPNGYESFFGVNKISKDRFVHLKFTNEKELRCSEDHPILTVDGIIKAKDLTKKHCIETEDKLGCFVKSKRIIKKKIELFDIVNSGKDHLYFSNGIVSHNCEFLGSSNTLISSSKLQEIAYRDVVKILKIGEDNQLDIYIDVIKGDGELTKDHIYVMTVDVAEGKNLDSSAISVFDVSTTPYKQVAKYKNSHISPVLFPTVIAEVGKYYNNAYVLIEINNNPQIADILISEMEYENVLRVESGNKQSQRLAAGFGRGVQTGLKMSHQVKKIGCLNLKTLIESNKLEILDFDTVSELSSFVSTASSWSAEEGANDDMVMTLVIFSWITTQKYFRDIVNHDLRKQLQLEKFNKIEESNFVSPIIDRGQDNLFFFDGEDVWFTGDYDESYKMYLQNS